MSCAHCATGLEFNTAEENEGANDRGSEDSRGRLYLTITEERGPRCQWGRVEEPAPRECRQSLASQNCHLASAPARRPPSLSPPLLAPQLASLTASTPISSSHFSLLYPPNISQRNFASIRASSRHRARSLVSYPLLPSLSASPALGQSRASLTG